LDKFQIRREGSEVGGSSEEPAGEASPGPREV